MKKRTHKPRFSFIDKSAPEYNPYGTVFTERQEAIIRGEPPERVRRTEITIIIRKAQKLGFEDIVDTMLTQYEGLLLGENESKYTVEEAKEVLQKLTPWKIDWE